MALNPGHTLLNGHYRIVRLLGRGGFGFVYEAQDTLLNEKVAIKELIPALVGDEATLKRFLAEARATMRLTHKHIVRTHNVFQEGENYYIVMEYMAGGSLEERLRDGGALPVDKAVQVAAEVCEGLACAHEEQVVHCDLKPANILFDASGRAKVADFGIAHVSGEMLTRSWMTPAGFVAGTLPYMSPEQADGVRDDPRVDVYALGAVLYRMLTGRTYLVFDERETPGATADNVYRIRNEKPAPLSAHDRSVPIWLDGVVLKALAKRPEDRHPGATALRAALRRQQTGPAALPPTWLVAEQRTPASTQSPSRRTPPGPGVRAARAAKRKVPLPAWFWPAVAGAVALSVGLVIAVYLILIGRKPVVTIEWPPMGARILTGAETMLYATAVGSGYNIARLELNVDEMTVAVTSSSFEGGQSRLSLSQQWTFDHAGSYVVSSVAYDIRGKMSDVATVNVIVEKREARVPTEPPSPVAPQADTTQTRSKDGMTMLYVPAGDFAMGTDYGYSDNEKPMHTVTLEAYWIDRTEVTNAQFRMCVEAGACQAPTTCDRGEPTYNDGAKTDHPVVCVDWNQALAYCEWAGVRLPTEAEWEKAARGTDGRKYPWGPVADCSKAQARECGGQTVPVGSKAAGASPYGALDMAGNVYEWVNDWYHRNYYDVSPDSNPPGPASGSDKVLRGGRWDSIWIDVRASNRIDHSPTERSHYIGFRCAASPGE